MPVRQMPDKQTAMDMAAIAAATPEAAKYASQQLKQVAIETKSEAKYHELLGAFDSFADGVTSKFSSSEKSWAGHDASANQFQSMYDNLSQIYGEKLNEEVKGDIQLEIAFNDDAQFVRGYAVDGQSADQETVDTMDSLFNSWLVLNAGVINKDSTLYQSKEDKKDEISVDNNGAPIKADVDAIQKLIVDPEKGFATFVADKMNKDNSAAINVQLCAFPENAAQEQEESGMGLK